MVTKPHMVRIEDATYRALETLAAKNRRSVTAELALILELHIEVQEGWPA